MSCGFAKDRSVLMILRWYDLIPGSDCFVGCLFRQLLGYGSFGEVFRSDNADMQFVAVMTARLGLLFFFSIPSPPSLYYRPLLCLADCAPSLLSITCLTLAFTVPHTHASVPADVHPLCTVHARISSPLPYVSLHPLCTPPYPLTCVVPRPLYACHDSTSL